MVDGCLAPGKSGSFLCGYRSQSLASLASSSGPPITCTCTSTRPPAGIPPRAPGHILIIRADMSLSEILSRRWSSSITMWSGLISNKGGFMHPNRASTVELVQHLLTSSCKYQPSSYTPLQCHRGIPPTCTKVDEKSCKATFTLKTVDY